MIIRLADVKNEADQILAGAKDFISRMDYTEFLPDPDILDEYLVNLLSSTGLEVIVAEEGGRIVAGIGMAYGPLLWNPAIIQAEEIFWWASSDASPTAAVRVVKYALNRAKEDDIQILVSFKSLTSSPQSVGRFYENMGLRQVETSYVGVI